MLFDVAAASYAGSPLSLPPNVAQRQPLDTSNDPAKDLPTPWPLRRMEWDSPCRHFSKRHVQEGIAARSYPDSYYDDERDLYRQLW